MASVRSKQILWLSILFYLTNRFEIIVSLRQCGEFDGDSTTQQRIFDIAKKLGFESELDQLFAGFNQNNPIKMTRALKMLRNVKIHESAVLSNDLMRTIVSKMIKK